ncbi:hypothetical protein PGT21_031224 [Puccinia graminis f. sp. tritici]|uniref:Uncharacterized protein n=1 Tax=Puccinia graminis f. sp. tritici TaxID=56615 RepID=A0A5B0S3S1_PUCGR|nr:hypothetical protein PGT21_031224 [Puccinia graminis f. sp. tritici]KAA1131364.1 hypothetical protein PGTUg99_032781 [Puccinia graminis f. sp. tritici]
MCETSGYEWPHGYECEAWDTPIIGPARPAKISCNIVAMRQHYSGDRMRSNDLMPAAFAKSKVTKVEAKHTHNLCLLEASSHNPHSEYSWKLHPSEQPPDHFDWAHHRLKPLSPTSLNVRDVRAYTAVA